LLIEVLQHNLLDVEIRQEIETGEGLESCEGSAGPSESCEGMKEKMALDKLEAGNDCFR